MQKARTQILRRIAAAITIVALAGALPGVALAEEEESLWVDWWHNVADRQSKAEIPFVILFTIPPMLAVTPIWGGMELYGALTGGGDDDDDDE